MSGPNGKVNAKQERYKDHRTGRGYGPAAPTTPSTARGRRRNAAKNAAKASKAA